MANVRNLLHGVLNFQKQGESNPFVTSATNPMTSVRRGGNRKSGSSTQLVVSADGNSVYTLNLSHQPGGNRPQGNDEWRLRALTRANNELALGVKDLAVGEILKANGEITGSKDGSAYTRSAGPSANILRYIRIATGRNAQVYSNTPGSEGYFQWCGAFWVYCYDEMFQNRGFDPRRRLEFLSTSNTVKNHLNDGTVEKFQNTQSVKSSIQPGDILTVGASDSQYGSHFVMFSGWSGDDAFSTIEGNGIVGGESNGFEGVVTRTRNVDSIKYIVRPYNTPVV